MDHANACPLATPDKPTSGYSKHRRRGEQPCRECIDIYMAHINAYQTLRGRPKVERHCIACGDPWLTWNRKAKFCTYECRSSWLHRPTYGPTIPTPTALDLFVGPPSPRRPRPDWHTTSGRTWVAGNCRRCSTPFVIVDQITAVYCSRPCARSDDKDRRRALKREAFVEPVFRQRVFQRDGWRCQLCRRKVNRNAVVPHPLAPTLDHIIALANGGEHSMVNAQLACFECNSLKGDRPANDQLRLIG